MQGMDGAADAGVRASRRWTLADRNVFFDHFAMSGDVAEAAAAAGKTERSAHSLRRRSATFAAAWRVALDDGYERLETALVRQVMGETTAKLDVAAAVVLLDRRRRIDDGAAATRKGPEKANPLARAERELLKRLQALSKRPSAKVDG